MKKLIYCFVLIFISPHAVADDKVMSFIYEEKETGTEPVHVRYLVNKSFLRIDNGALQDDFLLFDRNKNIIYSINQEDQSILVIKSSEWVKPKFSFSVKVDQQILENAPEVAGKKILDFSKYADNKLCHRVQIIPDVYRDEMKAFIEYQRVLSGQQVKIIHNTPEDMRSPCLLVDQVYNSGDYYRLGLPIHETHSRGYVKNLKDYKQIKINQAWFVLPEGFNRYSISN